MVTMDFVYSEDFVDSFQLTATISTVSEPKSKVFTSHPFLDFIFDSQDSSQSQIQSSVGTADDSEDENTLDLNSVVLKASNYLLTQQYLTTGLKKLDDFLMGGFPTFGITELVGESGNGKTQLCLQLALTAQLPVSEGGLGSGVVYINTQSSFPSKRLSELTEHFKAKYGNLLPEYPMDNVLIEFAPETSGLLNCINERLPKLIETKGNFRLIIVDSIAALFRCDYDDAASRQRTNDIRLVGQSLHDTCRKQNAAIVVVNQVSASINYGGNIPALGLAWTNMITTRIQVARHDDIRYLHILSAPHLPISSIPFVITKDGFQDKN